MAYEIPGFSFTLPAGVDLSAAEFSFVAQDVNGLANVPAAGARTIGALNNKPKLGESATIVNSGIAQVIAGAAIPFVAGGTPVQCDASGRAVPFTSGFYCGLALEVASGAGIIIAVLLGVNHG
jgi:hypothetical protein